MLKLIFKYLRKCKVGIKYNDGLVSSVNGFHQHEPLSNCFVDVQIKCEDLKKKMIQNLSLNGRKEYLLAHQELLKKYDARELAQYWKNWSSVRGTFSYHRSKHAPKDPKELAEIIINEEHAKTSDDKVFLRFDNKN